MDGLNVPSQDQVLSQEQGGLMMLVAVCFGVLAMFGVFLSGACLYKEKTKSVLGALIGLVCGVISLSLCYNAGHNTSSFSESKKEEVSVPKKEKSTFKKSFKESETPIEVKPDEKIATLEEGKGEFPD